MMGPMKYILMATLSAILSSCAHAAQTEARVPSVNYELSSEDANTAAIYLVKRRDEITAEFQKINAVLTNLQKQADDFAKKSKEDQKK